MYEEQQQSSIKALFHVCRIKEDNGLYLDYNLDRKDIGVYAVLGFTGQTGEILTIQFDKELFTKDQAEEWCLKNNYIGTWK